MTIEELAAAARAAQEGQGDVPWPSGWGTWPTGTAFVNLASPEAVLKLISRLSKYESALQEIVDYPGWEDGGAEARYIAQEALK